MESRGNLQQSCTLMVVLIFAGFVSKFESTLTSIRVKPIICAMKISITSFVMGFYFQRNLVSMLSNSLFDKVFYTEIVTLLIYWFDSIIWIKFNTSNKKITPVILFELYVLLFPLINLTNRQQNNNKFRKVFRINRNCLGCWQTIPFIN